MLFKYRKFHLQIVYFPICPDDIVPHHAGYLNEVEVFCHFYKIELSFYLHNENMPIQIYRKFHLKKTENFQMKNTDSFFIFQLKT